MLTPEAGWTTRTVDYLRWHPAETKLAIAASAILTGLLIGSAIHDSELYNNLLVPALNNAVEITTKAIGK